MSRAKKFDKGKPDLSLNPMVALEQMARAFMLGEQKYGRYNYTAGMESSRLVGAALRHIHQWNEGYEIDIESGASHLGHALACLAMTLHLQEIGALNDNRFKGSSDSECDCLNPNCEYKLARRMYMKFNYRDLVVVTEGFYKRHKGFVKAVLNEYNQDGELGHNYAIELTDGLTIEIEDFKLQLLRQHVNG